MANAQLNPLAKQIADAQAAQAGIAAMGPAPEQIPQAMMGGMDTTSPMVNLPSTPPRVVGPDEGQQQINADQGRLQKVRWAQEHPWGTAENHPGVAGKIAHVLSVAGNIAGNIVAPATMSMIPGTQLNMQEKEGTLAKRLNTEIGDESTNQQKQALTAQEQEQTREMPITQQRQQTQLSESAGEQGLKIGPDGTLVPQTPEEYSPGFKTGEELKQAQIYGLKNPWAKLPDKEPLGNVDSINAGMADRYQILHPGKTLPPEFTLKPDATKGEFERLDKLLNGEESALGSQQQREIANQMRAQTYALAMQNSQNTQQARQLSEDAKKMKWVMGTDAAGNMVSMPLSQAETQKLTNLSELPSTELKDMFNARHAVALATQVGNPKAPETMGTLQLIDSLEKDGKLGVAASRMNKFLTRSIGASPGDDPRIAALLNKADLFTTGIMLAHFGASGGRSPAMLQHFVEMADAGKMDAPTLKNGTKALVNYMQERAMLPRDSGSTQPQGGGNAPKVGDTKNGFTFDGTGWTK